ncbi:PREDICTED: uncharacterized protein LOC107074196 [Polistes dominula]|uniref:Uncharacterized protein LOC107074196 n=1 Tax=Polistes dominula TaxID=743375 RepID=A0ABM1JEL7_POLDO|nr:PREDICTED: uncharacterized protein LOC107074196 [Polistes dominula]
MSDFKNLEQALRRLRKNVAKFPIGAVSLYDHKPVEEKIQILRGSTSRLNSKKIMVKAKINYTKNKSSTKSKEDSFEMLQDSTAKAIINNNAIKLCLRGCTIQDIMFNKYKTDIKKKMIMAMRKLFMLNDAILSNQQSVENAFQKQLILKIECQKSILDYHTFLKEQDTQRKEKLQKTNPTIAENKEKILKFIKKINIIKKLITNFVATSAVLLMKEPLLIEMLEKHGEIINEETIMKLTENARKGRK